MIFSSARVPASPTLFHPAPRLAAMAALGLAIGTLVSCSTQSPKERGSEAASGTASPAPKPKPGVNTVAYDKDIWQQLLTDHAKIYRRVVHRQEGDLGVVEATTESDDPATAARIIEHAKAMQTRVVAGAPVRLWDPVFEELFAGHDQVKLEISTTGKGVKIVESSRDPRTIAALRSHAMGVSDFVRHGHASANRETWKLAAGSPLPPPEVAIGGVPHRFLLSQPDTSQVAMLKEQGVAKLMNFRKNGEPGTYDERATAQSNQLEYCGIPYKEADELTDAVLAQAREQFKAAEETGAVLAPHCRTGNRVGPGWAMYLALDKGEPVESAIGSAKVVGMVDPMYESITRDAIRRELAKRTGATAEWKLVTGTLTPAQETQKQRAEEARGVMFSRLLAALGEAMNKSGADGQPVGPVGAISVCKEQALRIAQAVSRERGVMIGRTSDQLRNPSNTAPRWATALLADKPNQPRMTTNPDGSLGVTLPIAVASTCVACHGPADQIDSMVREALHSAYPKDRATGYKEGDLRGWFWVEVPPMAHPKQP